MVKVLIVDDSKEFRKKVKTLLINKGLDVSEKENGREGYELLKENNSFNLLIVDHHMPEMDGLAMLKKIREEEIEVPPIIMLTTETDPDFKREIKTIGIDFFMLKPISEKNLSRVIDKLTEKRPG
ncbi:MAG: response regulator [Bdellovibrionota bacterium]|nr:response regulator [Bdellovibrionota bacterium]MEC8624716.1 response regulator [Bdellovibrionota bacterium]|tara:strand:+ start:220 stop:594 length:375 start_codon:yes stop_codon:yes gene_type:complete